MAVADPGGTASVHRPMGPNSFIFAFVSAEKHLHQRSVTPQWVGTPSQREILGPQLGSGGGMDFASDVDGTACSSILFISDLGHLGKLSAKQLAIFFVFFDGHFLAYFLIKDSD